MKLKSYLALLVVSAGMLITLASFQSVPGYMDAEYYYSMGLRIVKDGTFTEPFIWNYLAGVRELPHPGFMYWMPFPALIAAAGMKLTGWYNFAGGRLGGMFLACFIPLITMNISYQLTDRRIAAYFAGGLAILPAFYSVFLTTTDSFAITILLGGLFTRLAIIKGDHVLKYILLGLTAGLLHLTRTDGLIWAVGGILLASFSSQQKSRAIITVMSGYLLIIGPWLIRNLIVLGHIFPEGNSRMFWLREYNDLFLYRTDRLNMNYWIGQGITGILRNVAKAASENLITLVFVQGQLILFPLMVWGGIKARQKVVVKVSLISWALIFTTMSVIFPFAGMRGGYFHSGAALQPLLWSLGGVGLIELVGFAAGIRGWDPKFALKLFAITFGIILIISSGYIYWDRVIGTSGEDPIWDDSFLAARDVDEALTSFGNDGLVMVNNPPGYFAATGKRSVVIPSDNFSYILLAARDMNVKYLVLEANHPPALNHVYQNPQQVNELLYLDQVNDAYLFQFP